jgi:hypothetical protein
MIALATSPVGAPRSGINRTCFSLVERSERNVSTDNMAPITKGLQIEPQRLLKDYLNGCPGNVHGSEPTETLEK